MHGKWPLGVSYEQVSLSQFSSKRNYNQPYAFFWKILFVPCSPFLLFILLQMLTQEAITETFATYETFDHALSFEVPGDKLLDQNFQV